MTDFTMEELQPENRNEYESFNRYMMERSILQFGDRFEVEISWAEDTTIMTGAFALAGTLIGAYAGGKIGAAVGAGVGGVTGYGVSKFVSLRQLWGTIQHELEELLYILYNYLRQLDPIDYVRAFQLLISNKKNYTEFLIILVEFVAEKLGREVITRIALAA